MPSSGCDAFDSVASGGQVDCTGRGATVRLPGTCGEWVQGTLDGVPCLISCAMDWYAGVTVSLGANSGVEVDAYVGTDGDIGAGGCPSLGAAPKAIAALRLALAARGIPKAAGALRLANPLPRGRGYASSTADVAGAIYAVGAALGRPFTADETARLAVQVEPSDSTIFPGPTLFAHRDASFQRPLAALPALAVVILDPGGAVDTLAFNAADHTATLRRLAPIHRAAFGRFEAGLAAVDPVELAQAATLSATVHQTILPSALVDAARASYADLGALGICRAHSGTLVGLIVRPEDAAEVARRAATRFPGVIVRLRRCVG